MSERRVVISGLGPVSGLGLGVEATWAAATAGRSAIAPIQAFDASGFDCRIAAEVRDFKVSQFVPKSYRKAAKVMARDIELTVAAADLAARDAGLATKATAAEGQATTYPPERVGAHIGAGLIAADVNELTSALAEARDEHGRFDIHKWGREGMTHLTPLWLLKYLPNMLACHVTIIHDAQGPSNTITCAEASAGLSIGESMRVIQRGDADICFCGGVDSKLNPMAFLRQLMTDRYTTDANDDPAGAVRPFSQTASGCVVGEGGGIVILEALESFESRAGAAADAGAPYGELVGFGASQGVHRDTRNLRPQPDGAALASAIRAAMRDADVSAAQIDLIVPFGSGVPDCDQSEAAALRTVFGSELPRIPIASAKPLVGNCMAGAGAIDVCVAAKALREQHVPAIVNCHDPLDSLNCATAPAQPAKLRNVLIYSVSLGGQNVALLLRRLDG